MLCLDVEVKMRGKNMKGKNIRGNNIKGKCDDFQVVWIGRKRRENKRKSECNIY
jgi:hypothetical protein